MRFKLYVINNVIRDFAHLCLIIAEAVIKKLKHKDLLPLIKAM